MREITEKNQQDLTFPFLEYAGSKCTVQMHANLELLKHKGKLLAEGNDRWGF